MSVHFICHPLAALALVCGTAAAAASLTAPELQRLLQSAPLKPVEFVEIRESPWLAQPVETRGTMISRSGVLEKRIERPREEVWRLLPDRVEFEGAGPSGVAANGRKQILFSQSPAVAVLSDTLRHLVAGDLSALERNFRIDVSGEPAAWSARLTPFTGEAVRVIDHVDLQGAGSELRVIVVVDRPGERITTRLKRQ